MSARILPAPLLFPSVAGSPKQNHTMISAVHTAPSRQMLHPLRELWEVEFIILLVGDPLPTTSSSAPPRCRHGPTRQQ